MSYEKQTWQTGDVVTSAKLNHMEDGIAGGGSGALAVTVTKTGFVYTADKTAGEIINALPLVFEMQEIDGTVWIAQMQGYAEDAQSGYSFTFNDYTLTAATLGDYPSYDEGGQ